MDTRRLGRTDHASSVAVLGAAAFALATPEETEIAWSAALAAGVNHLDVAPLYGAAEVNIGPLLPAVRNGMFVACKTTRRNPDGVRAQLENSLSVLGCDAFDLYQLHAVTDLDELSARKGAAAAILQARDEGLCRFVGITGHDAGAPAAHAEALRRWDLDTVMFPVSPRLWGEPSYRRTAEALLSLCGERDIGVMAIKAVSRQPWSVGPEARAATTWYEPFTSPEDVARGIRFTLSTPGVHAFCTPGDMTLLPRALEAAIGYAPMNEEERASAIAATAGDAVIGRPA